MPSPPRRDVLRNSQQIDDILWDVVQGTVSRLGLEDCVIYLLDPDRTHLVQRAAWGPKNPKDREILAPIRLRVGKGVVGTVAATGNPLRLGDTHLSPLYVADDRLRRSELAVPMKFHDEVIGVLDSEHSLKDFFTAQHEQTFTTIAAVTASRIGRTWIDESLKG